MKRVLKVFGKILKIMGIIIAMAVLFVVGKYLLFPHLKSIPARINIPEIKEVGVNLENIAIPQETVIIGIGEATHGNAEFQELKEELLFQLANEGTCFAIGFEMEYSDGLLLENYIQGGEGQIEEVLKQTSYVLYHTEQMKHMFEMMREYNMNATEMNRIHVFGFDMQSCSGNVSYLLDYCEKNQISEMEDAVKAIECLEDASYEFKDKKKEDFVKNILEIKEQLNRTNKDRYSDMEFEFALHATDVICQFFSLPTFYDENSYEQYAASRDKAMADNIKWMSDWQKLLGNETIMVTAHNSHLSQTGYMGITGVGTQLDDMYGDGYFVIGTEFFNTEDNISVSRMISSEYKRENHKFCSADPLAYQAKNWENGRYYLDMHQIDETQKLYDKVHGEVLMGAIGEGYMPTWYIGDSAYREKTVPADAYDGIVYFYETTPITLLNEI